MLGLGLGLGLEYFKLLDKERSYIHFLKVGWEKAGNMEDFLDWEVDNNWDWAVQYTHNSRRPLYCVGCEEYSIRCRS